jgi:hypothetical protein
MKNITLGIIIILAVFAAGCTPQQNEMVQDMEEIEEDIQQARESNEEINFMCCNAMEQCFYFLGEKDVYINAIDGERESWLLDGKYYYKMTVGSTTYLVNDITQFDDYKMSVDAMVVSLKTSEKYPGFDCEKGVVTEDHMKLPDYPMITNEELGELMIQQMMQQG